MARAKATPPSTAIGGITKTKWRMPVYSAGRFPIAIASGSVGASVSLSKMVLRRAGSPRRGRFAQAVAAQPRQEQRHEAEHGVDQGKAAEDAGAEREAGAKADDEDRARRRLRIFLGEADEAQHQDDHGHREGRILRVHEHVAV